MSSNQDRASDLCSFPVGGSAIVFGATGGLGKSLAAAIAESGGFEQILAISRNSTPSLELEDETTIADAARYAADAPPIRLAIDATGFLHDASCKPEKSWRHMDADQMRRGFAVNAIGPALLMKHFLPLMAPSGKAVFATLSARVGSIGDNRLGGWYSYRASKAALNQFVRTAAIELKRIKPEAICVALHPGTVDTPLSQPFSKSGLDIHAPASAADHLLTVIDRLGPDRSGGFFDWRGQTIPW
ncbi:MAG: SDR family NAD(P)-dependent oxidoreductase [Pseudomonadota bacterium]